MSVRPSHQKWTEVHTELGRLMSMPPFSVDNNKRYDIQDEMTEYTGKYMAMFRKAEESGEWAKIDAEIPFSDIKKKYADELEEASLYLKRYGIDKADEAAKAYKNEQSQ